MPKCIVCGNRSIKTNAKREGVRYHGFPKNDNLRREWFKVLGIDRCHKWQRICSNHFIEENYKTGKKRYLLPNAIPQPNNRNGFPSNYATQSNHAESGNNGIYPLEQNIIREENIENSTVNNFISPSSSSILPENNEVMPDHTLGSGLRCSVKNCFNRHSENLSMFRCPKDYTLRKMWIEKCGINEDAPEIEISAIRVCSTHFELDCFTNTALKNRLKPGSVPLLFLDSAPESTNEVSVFSICEDQFISPIDNEAAEQLSEEEKNNEIDNTSMIIDLTIDDSSNSSLSITLEPIEERTSQCIIMDVCNTEDFTMDKHGFIFEMFKKAVLPSLYWKSEHLGEQYATGFYQRDTFDVIVKKVFFHNNLVPTIQIYGKKYEYKMSITTIKDVDDLLEKLDSIERCYGRDGFVFEECIGYRENSEDSMCSGCQGLVEDRYLQGMKAKFESIHHTMESFNNRLAEKKETILALRKRMAEMKNRQRRLYTL
ncbi:unnamed protein product [Macrosiphum euphorbiae]|uniref:THAP-type domain-containing protein n=1 Tax=Macrosiphum euphorbiae TaxID=13131 RepID=A0AAV0WY75_9HEMI|nr:unnamed protein product [Macrosiphum euphorbiae]